MDGTDGWLSRGISAGKGFSYSGVVTGNILSLSLAMLGLLEMKFREYINH